MRDLQIMEEWLTKLREQKRETEHRYLLQAEAEQAVRVAYQAELCTVIIEGIRLLDKDSGEFVKRHLT